MVGSQRRAGTRGSAAATCSFISLSRANTVATRLVSSDSPGGGVCRMAPWFLSMRYRRNWQRYRPRSGCGTVAVSDADCVAASGAAIGIAAAASSEGARSRWLPSPYALPLLLLWWLPLATLLYSSSELLPALLQLLTAAVVASLQPDLQQHVCLGRLYLFQTLGQPANVLGKHALVLSVVAHHPSIIIRPHHLEVAHQLQQKGSQRQQAVRRLGDMHGQRSLQQVQQEACFVLMQRKKTQACVLHPRPSMWGCRRQKKCGCLLHFSTPFRQPK